MFCASSSGRRRPIRISLVCLSKSPDEPSLLSRCGVGAEGLYEVGDFEKFGENGSARRLGRMRGEHGPKLQMLKSRAEVLGVGPLLGYAVKGFAQPGPLRSPVAAQLGCPVDLLGDIGELEVGGKGAGEEQGRTCRDVRKLLGKPAASSPITLRALEFGNFADLSDEVQEVRTLCAGKFLPEQGGHETDVPPQGSMALLGRDRVIRRDGVAHIAANLGPVAGLLRHRRIVQTGYEASADLRRSG